MVTIKPSAPQDRKRIYDILMNSQIFGKVDADCVDEMFELAMTKPSPDQYRFLSAWDGDHMIAFGCYGMTSLTKATWDYYWLCALPEARGKGSGGALMRHGIRQATLEGGRLMVLYSSTDPRYAFAQRVFDELGFALHTIIPGYYDVGDDLKIYIGQMNMEYLPALADPVMARKPIVAPGALQWQKK